MDEIKSFVDTVYDRYGVLGFAAEEDQKLPPREVLEKVCHVLLNVSTMQEEQRYPSFRVCFIPPESELLQAYLYAHTMRFETPIPFHAKELHRLAPALNAEIS